MVFLYGAGLFVLNHAPELVGFLLPPLVDILNRDVPNDEERHIVAVMTCIAVAFLLKGNLLLYNSPEQFAYFLALVFVECNNTYNLYFKRSFLRTKLQESLVTPSVSPSVQSP